MDPATIIVACVTGLLSVGATVIFVRQEKRIAMLEAKVEQLGKDHIACETDRVRLEIKVEHLEATLAKLKVA